MAYATVAQVKTYMNAKSDTGDDALIEALIERAQARIERVTHRVFEATSATRYFTPGLDTHFATLYFDEDLASITTIINGDSIEVTASEYVTIPRNRVFEGITVPIEGVQLLDSSGKYWTHDGVDPEGAISVTGAWGYSTTPPDDIVQATIRYTVFLFTQAQNPGLGVDSPTVSPEGMLLMPPKMPADLMDYLHPFVRGF